MFWDVIFLFVMEGFFKRIWGKWRINRVVFLKKRIYIVRFYNMESRKKVLEEGVLMFGKKFLIVELWSFNMDVKKIDVKKVFILVKFRDFEIKYWGNLRLRKITGIIREMIKADRVTTERELFRYAGC